MSPGVATAPWKRSRSRAASHSWLLLRLLLVATCGLATPQQAARGGVHATTAAGPPPLALKLGSAQYAVYSVSASYLDAVATCAIYGSFSGAPDTLLHVAQVLPFLQELRSQQPSAYQGLLGNLSAAARATNAITATATATAASGRAGDGNGWTLWTWEADRGCSVANYSTVQGQRYDNLVTDTLPCDSRLPFICMEATAARALGLTVSTEWYSQYVRLPPDAASLSGLALQESGIVLGSWAAPDAFTLPYSDEDAFWKYGPVSAAAGSGGTDALYHATLFREGRDTANGQAAVACSGGRPTSTAGALLQFSDTFAAASGGSTAYCYNYIQGAHDYVVSVEGCYGATLERLVLVTRTGRQFQLGRGRCTNSFREAAPVGGYFAGFTGYTNASTGSDAGDGFAGLVTHIRQVRLLWAVPAGSGQAAVSAAPVQLLPALKLASPPCKTFLNAEVNGTSTECDGMEGRVCPSNLCCGSRLLRPTDLSPAKYTCDALSPCQMGCRSGYGHCGALPEWPVILLVPAVPPLNVDSSSVYFLRRDVPMKYDEALQECRTATYLGLTWQMAGVLDAMALIEEIPDVRKGAATAFSKGFWAAVADGAGAGVAREASCWQVYSLESNTEALLSSSACNDTFYTVCKASMTQNYTTFPAAAYSNYSNATPVPAAAGEPTTVMTTSRAYGTGTSVGSCNFSLLPVAGMGAAAGDQSAEETLNTPRPPTIRNISVSFATTQSAWDYVDTVVGLSLGLINGDINNKNSSTMTAGVVSTGGWHTLTLAPGELIIAVTGCAGGYVERLVFHTSYGRLWTPPFTWTSVCTVNFTEAAPAGGYLLGFQGTFGNYLEQVRFSWSKPVINQVASSLPAPEITRSTPSQPRSTNFVAVAVAIACSMAGLVTASALVCWWWRRRKSSGAAASAGPKNIDLGSASAAPSADVIAGNPLNSRAADDTDNQKGAHETALAVTSQRDGCALPVLEAQLGVPAVRATAGSTCQPAGPDQGRALPAAAVSKSVNEQSGASNSASALGLSNSITHVSSSNERSLPLTVSGASKSQPQRRCLVESDGAQRGGRLTASSATDCLSPNGNLMPANTDRAMYVVLVPGLAGSGGSALGAPAEPSPMVLGQNVIVDFKSVLGRGCSSVVHRGTLQVPGGQIAVAIKALTNCIPSEPSAAGVNTSPGASGGSSAPFQANDPLMRMLAQEVAVLARVEHPNIVKFYGACLEGPRPFLVEELVPLSLTRVIHGRNRDGSHRYEYGVVDVLRIARDVASAMAYLHPTVVHRDLKPSNVLLDAQGTAKVSDFGLARFKTATALSTTNVEIGTAAYMCPESFSRETKLTDRSDIYSLGVIMWELVTRRRPWEDTRNAFIGFLVAVERQRPKLPPEDEPTALCPPKLRSLIERCWRHNPEERPSSAEIVKFLTLLLVEEDTAPAAPGPPL